MKKVSIFTFEIEKEIYGLEFDLIDRIEDLSENEEKSGFKSEEFRTVDLGEELLGKKNRHDRRHLLIISRFDLRLMVDRALNRNNIEGTHILPLPAYLFEEEIRPFRGLFPHRERACLLVNIDYFSRT